MPRNAIIAIVVIILLAVAGWYLTRPKQTSVPQSTETSLSTQSAAPVASDEASMNAGETMVSITQSGYSPKDITIKIGDSVVWTNNDSATHTISSDPHPTHTLYPFLNVGPLKPGEKKSVQFTTAGTFTYHDHLNPSLTGTVTVQ